MKCASVRDKRSGPCFLCLRHDKKPSKNAGPQSAGTETNEGEIESVRRRGREDRVHRVHSQVWMAMTKAHPKCPAGHQQMGPFFLGDSQDAARIFERIEYNASDPGRPRKSLDGRNVVDIVAAKPGFAYTKDVYDSDFWRVVGAIHIEPDEREEMINAAFRRLVFDERPQYPDLQALFRVISNVRLPMTPAAYRQTVQRFARTASMSSLTLLCLLYRRAIETGALREMKILRDGIQICARRLCNKNKFSGAVASSLLFLIRRRVFAGQLSLEHDADRLYWARDLLIEWETNCWTEKEMSWLHDQVWYVACMLENLETAEAFMAPDEPPDETDGWQSEEDVRLACEHNVRAAIMQDPIGRRLALELQLGGFLPDSEDA